MKRWYVVQVYTGFEDTVKAEIKKRILEEGLEELFGDIVVPKGEVVERFSGSEAHSEKIFPGYLLLQMDMTGESFKLVSTAHRVTRFLGGSSPMPISEKEVDRIFSQMSGQVVVSSDRELFSAGSEVHISSGPFSGFVGIVETVDEEHERITVMVSIFGRMTPVELGFDQVKR
ncbi:transcription termination/antitermination protein NusG [bacterium]|jgi:transcription termination/antitermination protein NusG|nr:transcription termination/antitermination protein NusG [bacterium]